MKKGKCTFSDAWDQMQVPSPYNVEIVLLQDLDHPPIQAIIFEVLWKFQSIKGKETVAAPKGV